jgi:hypothetical protein
VRLKITKEKRGAHTVIHVDGQLLAEGLPELKRTLRPGDQVICLDLEHLIAVDVEAIEEIRRMAADGVRVINASPYIKLLLQIDQDSNHKPTSQGRAS